MTETIADGSADDLRLLQVDVETIFTISSSDRMERQNPPDGSAAPRLYFSGCPQGNIVRVRHDVDDDSARKLLAIGTDEPAWRDPNVLPGCLSRLIDVLTVRQPVATVSAAVIYRLPNHLKYEHRATIVRGDSIDGATMLARFAKNGMPKQMVDAGFKGVGDFWAPWCVAIERDEIASIAFAARLGKSVGESGAEIGVYTFPGFRRGGLAAAVTATWTSMPSLDGFTLFYSTARSNRSSQRVATRLDLRLIGASFSIG